MSIGRLPRLNILHQHYDSEQANMLWTIRMTILRGNINHFSATVNADARLIKNGTYHLYGQCSLLTMRNFFKTLQKILTNEEQIKQKTLTNKLSLVKGMAVMNRMPSPCAASKVVFSIEDLMMFACQLVDKGIMKGYLSEKHSTVVISKENAFPTIKT